MKIIDRIKKVLTGGDWSVAFRRIGSISYKIASSPHDQWCADPFVIEVNGEHYIFVEQYDKSKEKGCIGYFHFEDGIPVNRGIVIENRYHMSYPDVFEYGGKYYMIPETSANNTIELYYANGFPNKWKKKKVLLSGKKYIDSTVYQDGTDYYLISYTAAEGFEVHVFSLDMEKQEIKMLSKKHYERNVARPGGRLFIEDGKLMRPAQDCSRKYGESLIIYQVDSINNAGKYEEHEVKRIVAEELNICNKPERVHQLTNDGSFEVVDVFKEKIDLLHGPKILMRSRRK